MMPSLRNAITMVALTTSAVAAHYANMGMDGVSCYIYNGIKGTPDGHMIVRNANGTWVDHDNKTNGGTITVIHSQRDYDQLEVKTKVGIVCAPDSTETTEIGIPYVEMEPTDADFYSSEQTVYTSVRLGKRWEMTCILRFCKNTA